MASFPGGTITWSATLRVVDCCNCGILFGVPHDMDDRNRNDPKRQFYCPSGHSQHYTGPTEAQKLRKQLETAEQHLRNTQAARDAAREQADAAERSARAYRGVATRLKNRAAAGVCPCCHRTFPELAAHMSSKHPEFISAEPDDTATGTLPVPETGTCAFCGKTSALNRDGAVRWHWLGTGRKTPCKGSRNPPASPEGTPGA